MSGARLVEDMAAAWRLTRLVTTDVIASKPRMAVLRWALRMPQCESVYSLTANEQGRGLVDYDVRCEREWHGPAGFHTIEASHLPPTVRAAIRPNEYDGPFRWASGDTRERVTPDRDPVPEVAHPMLVKFLDCPYCVSVWAALAVLVLRGLRLGWVVRLAGEASCSTTPRSCASRRLRATRCSCATDCGSGPPPTRRSAKGD